MRLSMQLNYAGDFHASLPQILAFEREGLEVLWVAEAYGLDSPTLMGYLAAKTTTLQIGSAILPIYTRTPTLIAQTAAGLDEVSQGRALIGLGASGPQVIEGWHGVRYDRPLQRTREIVEICRKVWSREHLRHDGIYQIPLPQDLGTGFAKPLKLISHPLRSRIPIYIASLGPKNVEMTAEIAEGWLPIFFIPERMREVWGKAIDAGLEKRPEELGTLDIVAGGMLAIGEDLDHLLDLARPYMALYIGGMGARGKNFYNELAGRFGYEKEAERIQELYLAGRRQEAMAEVPLEFIRQTSLVGPMGYVAERIEAFREAGVTTLSVSPVGNDPLGSFVKVRQMVS